MNKKSKLVIVLIAFLMLLQISSAKEKLNDYNNYTSLKMNFDITGSFDLIASSADAKTSEATAILTFVPKEDSIQTINKINFNSDPEAEVTKSEDATFEWKNPSEKQFSFGITAQINVNNALIKINEKIPFPITGAYTEFIQPTEYIDITSEIKNQAQKLATGEDDLYVVAYKVGSWVQQNIMYNLSTLTADAVQKSSWVYAKRQGVCKELTNLFISMMRSLGVPARYVSGMVYTNIGNDWEPHAWAEVYFPDKGWIPFDVTLGEYGWINPTHIKLKINEDSGDPSIRYNWKSKDTRLEGKEIKLKTNIISKGEKINSPLEFGIQISTDGVGPGSIAPIELDITNNNDYYIADSFVVTKATNLTEKNVKSIIIKPGEKKKLFWLTKIPENLEEDYIYYTTIEIQDQFHKVASRNLTYRKDGTIISLNDANTIIENVYQEKEIKTISSKLALTCTNPKIALINNPIEINCNLANRGNTRLDNIQVCYKTQCQNLDLSIAEEKKITFQPKDLKLGTQSMTIQASNKDTKASEIATIEIIENPGLKILSMEYPKTIKYGDKFNIKFVVSTKIPIKDIKIKINDAEVATIQSIESIQQIAISTNSKNFLYKKGIKLGLDFKDPEDKLYNLEYNYPIQVTEISWYMEFLHFLGLV